jgi:hypothetical protein
VGQLVGPRIEHHDGDRQSSVVFRVLKALFES